MGWSGVVALGGVGVLGEVGVGLWRRCGWECCRGFCGVLCGLGGCGLRVLIWKGWRGLSIMYSPLFGSSYLLVLMDSTKGHNSITASRHLILKKGIIYDERAGMT